MENVLQLNCKVMKGMKFILLVAGLFCLITAKAQVNNLRIDSAFLTAFPANTSVNDTFSVNIIIHNDSSTAYIGKVYIGTQVNTDSAHADTVSGATIYYPSYAANENIPAGGSITRPIFVSVLNPPFIVGSSAVVIWPIMNNNGNLITSSNSLRTLVTIYPMGINEPNDKNLKVYMSGQQLVVQENDLYLLKNVKLYDISGALLCQQQISLSGEISMASFAPGIYLAEVNYADNTSRLFKVFNTR
jgi:hypothetical protein